VLVGVVVQYGCVVGIFLWYLSVWWCWDISAPRRSFSLFSSQRNIRFVASSSPLSARTRLLSSREPNLLSPPPPPTTMPRNVVVCRPRPVMPVGGMMAGAMMGMAVGSMAARAGSGGGGQTTVVRLAGLAPSVSRAQPWRRNSSGHVGSSEANSLDALVCDRSTNNRRTTRRKQFLTATRRHLATSRTHRSSSSSSRSNSNNNNRNNSRNSSNKWSLIAITMASTATRPTRRYHHMVASQCLSRSLIRGATDGCCLVEYRAGGLSVGAWRLRTCSDARCLRTYGLCACVDAHDALAVAEHAAAANDGPAAAAIRRLPICTLRHSSTACVCEARRGEARRGEARRGEARLGSYVVDGGTASAADHGGTATASTARRRLLHRDVTLHRDPVCLACCSGSLALHMRLAQLKGALTICI